MVWIDDDPEFIALHSQTLKDAGYQLFCASEGEQGISLAKETHPDVILLDIMMPNFGGQVTKRELTKEDQLKDIPVIFLSSITNPEDPEIIPAAFKTKYNDKATW